MKSTFFVLNLIWVLIQWIFSWQKYGTFISYSANLLITIAMMALVSKIAGEKKLIMIIPVFLQLIFLGLSIPYSNMPMIDSPNNLAKVVSVFIVLSTYFWFSKVEKVHSVN
jgi:hypothetical protein